MLLCSTNKRISVQVDPLFQMPPVHLQNIKTIPFTEDDDDEKKTKNKP